MRPKLRGRSPPCPPLKESPSRLEKTSQCCVTKPARKVPNSREVRDAPEPCASAAGTSRTKAQDAHSTDRTHGVCRAIVYLITDSPLPWLLDLYKERIRFSVVRVY
ncbi:hypothetical protein EVAR_56722_1 [Eumeta japonica]|uniref:Uncharacterized protein n=1 Tax=Eumeta variegata TaxID=151549 RepID=A0A4C1Y1M5_EUMVA|nr:hypothetical protein EVAR_56722_1 [Eumeta japonica]